MLRNMHWISCKTTLSFVSCSVAMSRLPFGSIYECNPANRSREEPRISLPGSGMPPPTASLEGDTGFLGSESRQATPPISLGIHPFIHRVGSHRVPNALNKSLLRTVSTPNAFSARPSQLSYPQTSSRTDAPTGAHVPRLYTSASRRRSSSDTARPRQPKPSNYFEIQSYTITFSCWTQKRLKS